MTVETAMWTASGNVRKFTDNGDGTMLIEHFAPGDAGYDAAAALVISNPHNTYEPEPTEAEIAARELAEWRAGASLTVVQLLIGLVDAGWITNAEGEAWLSGSALPPSAVAVVSTLPTEAQFAAKARMLRMTSVARTDGLVDVLAAAVGKTAPEVDTFFATYSVV